jgi:hypothetical protein
MVNSDIERIMNDVVPMRWQYKLLKLSPEPDGIFNQASLDEDELDRNLNELGWDGWELSGVVQNNRGHGATRDIVLVFKRPHLTK